MELSEKLIKILKKYDEKEFEKAWDIEQSRLLNSSKKEFEEKEKEYLECEIAFTQISDDFWKEIVLDLDYILTLIPDSCLNYIEYRYNTTNNVFHKGKYAFYLWRYKHKNNKKDQYQFFLEFYDSLFSYLLRYQLQENPDYTIMNFLVIILSQSARFMKDEDKICKIVKESSKIIVKFLNTHSGYEIFFEISGKLCNFFKKCLSSSDFDEFINAIGKEVERLKKSDKRGSHYPNFMEIYGILTEEDRNITKAKIAEYWERCATEITKTENNDKYLIAADYYKEAIKLYYQAGNEEKMDKLEKEMRKCLTLGFEHVKGFEIPVEVTRAELVSYFDVPKIIRLPLKDMIKDIWQKVERSLENARNCQEENFSFVDLLDYSEVSDEGLIVSKERHEYFISVPIIKIYMTSLLKNLLEILETDEFFSFIDKININIEKDIVKSGIEALFEQKYISAIHILVPQVEKILKELLKSKGKDVISIKDKRAETFRGPHLDSLIESAIRNKLINHIFAEIMKFFFLDIGENIRNKTAHGNMKTRDCNDLNTNFVFFIILNLLCQF